jgi:hypothetical protein
MKGGYAHWKGEYLSKQYAIGCIQQDHYSIKRAQKYPYFTRPYYSGMSDSTDIHPHPRTA